MEYVPMSPEEMDRKLQFLVEHAARSDARFDADMQRLTEKTDPIADNIAQVTRMLENTVELVGQLALSQEATERELRENVGATARDGPATAGYGSAAERFLEAFERHLRDDHGQRPS